MKTHKYTVFGRRGFPVDVLRIQQAWPRTTLDSNEVVETHKTPRRAEEMPYVIDVEGLRTPNASEWHARGWYVADPSQVAAFKAMRHAT